VPRLPDHLGSSPVGDAKLGGEILKRHQRDRIVAASIEVFATRGYAETTVDDLVSAARVGVGNFYELLGGKDGCFEAAFDASFEMMGVRLGGTPEQEPWAGQLLSYLDRLLDFAESEQAMARLLAVEAMAAGEKVQKRLDRLFAQAVSYVSLGRKRSKKAFKLPGDSLEFGLVAGVGGVVRELFAQEKPIRPVRDELARFLLKPYLSPAQVQKALAA
jgi:AcrR family transcriptional regulator